MDYKNNKASKDGLAAKKNSEENPWKKMEKIKAAPIVPKDSKLPTPTVTQDTSNLDEAFVGCGQTPGMDKYSHGSN